MTPRKLTEELTETECMAIKAIPYIPERSKYKLWVFALLAGEIDVPRYLKLRARLQKFYAQS